MTNRVLNIVRGLPGSGKSTFAKRLVDGDELLHCEADQFHMDENGVYKFNPDKVHLAHGYCRNKVEALMQLDSEKIAVSNTFTQDWEMAPYYDLAKRYGYMVFTVIVENRHGGQNVHDVPEEVMDKMANRFSFKLR